MISILEDIISHEVLFLYIYPSAKPDVSLNSKRKTGRRRYRSETIRSRRSLHILELATYLQKAHNETKH